MKTHRITESRRNTNNSTFLLVASFTALVVLAFSYLFCVGASVAYVAAEKEATKEIATLQAEIGNRESEYFTLKEHIDLDLARNLGYSDNVPVVFLKNSGALSLGNNAR